LHEGGEVSAPVFARVAQQALAYWNVPHDVEVQDKKHFLLRAQARKEDVAEGSPERIVAEAEQVSGPQSASVVESRVQPQGPPIPGAQPPLNSGVERSRPRLREDSSKASPLPEHGTMVLDVAGGVLVPEFAGKSLRAALEEAESAGIELEVSGSGIAQAQSPPAGSYIPHGGHRSGGVCR